LQSSYDQVAKEYAAQSRDELNKKPCDRKMLDWLIEKANGLGVNLAQFRQVHPEATCINKPYESPPQR
jgi:hypothetical protein